MAVLPLDETPVRAARIWVRQAAQSAKGLQKARLEVAGVLLLIAAVLVGVVVVRRGRTAEQSDPLNRLLDQAPVDDEKTTPEDDAAIQAGRQDFRDGRVRSLDEVTGGEASG